MVYFYLAIAIIVEVVAVIAIIIGYGATLGDGRWAPKDATAEAQHALETAFATHAAHEERYLPSESISERYVTRREWDDGRDKAAAAINSLEENLESFAKEQRTVNREILNRLPR